jgi:hypothetical protein
MRDAIHIKTPLEALVGIAELVLEHDAQKTGYAPTRGGIALALKSVAEYVDATEHERRVAFGELCYRFNVDEKWEYPGHAA